jgi:two-component system, OmpR family, sensor histidine kinase KdpD
LFARPFSFTALGAGSAGVAIVTFTFSQLLVVNASTAGFFYLLVVLAVATASGFRVASVVSAIATLCFNFFFLPPVGLFTIADPENWVALFTFLLTALVASHLSDRAQKQAAEAKRRQHETEQLYALSRSILLTETSRSIGLQAAQSIAQIFDSPSVVILDGKTNLYFQGGAKDIEGLEPRMQDVVRLGSHQRDNGMDLDIWPIALGGNPIGALAALGIAISDGAAQSMLNLVAIALERVRTEEAANRAEVARQSEEFKSTLLDAIAHEFKTPLTSIKAAATGLQAFEERMTPDQQDLAAIIEEEADRLSLLVSEAVKIAEIDAGKVTPQLRQARAGSLLNGAKSSFQGRGVERILVAATPESDVTIIADPDLMTLALRQVLDNALKYSRDGVNCRIDRDAGRILIRIRDNGEGIPERDHERIFEKFYRRAGSRDRVPGSGLGLHIAREIARIHGGDLWVEPSSEPGSVFCFALPLTLEENQ